MHNTNPISRSTFIDSNAAPADVTHHDIAILTMSGLGLLALAAGVYALAVALGFDRETIELLTRYP